MPNLKEVKNRISSVISTQQITKAMKMVAAAKLRRAQDKIVQMRPYSQKLQEILANVSSSVADQSENAYATKREEKNILLVVITSDRGLCGGFNSYVQKRTLSLLNGKYKNQFDNGNVTLLTVGKKGRDFFKRREMDVNDEYYELFVDLSFEKARDAAEHVMERFKQGKYDKVELIYNEFKNVATQVVVNEQFLPILPKEMEEGDATTTEYIYEPDKEEILKELIPKSLKIKFYSAVLESNAAEHGARMTAMDKATENAGDLLKELRLTYNRTRQAAITKEILEIVGGAEALASE